MFIISIIGLLTGIYLIYISKQKNVFAQEEAKRYFSGFNEVDSNWSSNGRVYTNGIALIEDKKSGKIKFIKQGELCDIGILS